VVGLGLGLGVGLDASLLLTAGCQCTIHWDPVPVHDTRPQINIAEKPRFLPQLKYWSKSRHIVRSHFVMITVICRRRQILTESQQYRLHKLRSQKYPDCGHYRQRITTPLLLQLPVMALWADNIIVLLFQANFHNQKFRF